MRRKVYFFSYIYISTGRREWLLFLKTLQVKATLGSTNDYNVGIMRALGFQWDSVYRWAMRALYTFDPHICNYAQVNYERRLISPDICLQANSHRDRFALLLYGFTYHRYVTFHNVTHAKFIMWHTLNQLISLLKRTIIIFQFDS